MPMFLQPQLGGVPMSGREIRLRLVAFVVFFFELDGFV